jgi:hypothetical protein
MKYKNTFKRINYQKQKLIFMMYCLQCLKLKFFLLKFFAFCLPFVVFSADWVTAMCKIVKNKWCHYVKYDFKKTFKTSGGAGMTTCLQIHFKLSILALQVILYMPGSTETYAIIIVAQVPWSGAQQWCCLLLSWNMQNAYNQDLECFACESADNHTQPPSI